jgi:hypothetical protein
MKYYWIFDVPGGLNPPPAVLAQTSGCQERKVCYFSRTATGRGTGKALILVNEHKKFTSLAGTPPSR